MRALFLLIFAPLALIAQSGASGTVRLQTTVQAFTTTATGAAIDINDRDHLFHGFFWFLNVGNAVTDCHFTAQVSKDAGATWEDTNDSHACLTDGNSAAPVFVRGNLLRINLDTFVGTGTLTVAHVVYADAAGMTPKIFKAAAAVNCANEIGVWTPASGRRFRILGAFLSTTVVGNITLRDGTAGTIFAVIPPGMGQINFGLYGFISGAANRVLTMQGPALSTCSGTLMGLEE